MMVPDDRLIDTGPLSDGRLISDPITDITDDNIFIDERPDPGESDISEDSKGEDSKDENSKDENSKDENSKDENSKDENSKDENSKGEDSKGENSKGEDSKGEDSKDENSKGEDSKGERVKDSQVPGFLSTLRSLGVDEELIDVSEDVLCEPVEILLNLAKSNDIDPWDIDIVEVTDKFLEYIEEMKLTDLRISGRTLLYAAILLRMKSTGIVQEEEEDEVEEPDDDMDFYDIEEYPVPKLPIRRTATRPVTLQELITELKKAERVETRRKDRIRNQLQEKVEIATTDDVLSIAHEEDIKGIGEALYSQIGILFKGQEYITFSDLTSGNHQDATDRIMVYISLLFLAAEKKVWLSQKELFGELYIHPGCPEGPVEDQSSEDRIVEDLNK